jgi:hypothetical protein
MEAAAGLVAGSGSPALSVGMPSEQGCTTLGMSAGCIISAAGPLAGQPKDGHTAAGVASPCNSSGSLRASAAATVSTVTQQYGGASHAGAAALALLRHRNPGCSGGEGSPTLNATQSPLSHSSRNTVFGALGCTPTGGAGVTAAASDAAGSLAAGGSGDHSSACCMVPMDSVQQRSCSPRPTCGTKATKRRSTPRAQDADGMGTGGHWSPAVVCGEQRLDAVACGQASPYSGAPDTINPSVALPTQGPAQPKLLSATAGAGIAEMSLPAAVQGSGLQNSSHATNADQDALTAAEAAFMVAPGAPGAAPLQQLLRSQRNAGTTAAPLTLDNAVAAAALLGSLFGLDLQQQRQILAGLLGCGLFDASIAAAAADTPTVETQGCNIPQVAWQPLREPAPASPSVRRRARTGGARVSGGAGDRWSLAGEGGTLPAVKRARTVSGAASSAASPSQPLDALAAVAGLLSGV